MQNTHASTTFSLTEKEFTAARILVQCCLDNMGGKRPIDLDSDSFTWINLEDLTKTGTYSRVEAAGLLSSLQEKGFVCMDGKRTHVTTEGYRWMETMWGDPLDEAPRIRVMNGKRYVQVMTGQLRIGDKVAKFGPGSTAYPITSLPRDAKEWQVSPDPTEEPLRFETRYNVFFARPSSLFWLELEAEVQA